jgi:hypothetical protein
LREALPVLGQSPRTLLEGNETRPELYKVKISVIIPTRERVHYLQHSLATALAIPDSMVEVIVSDNHSRDGTADLLSAIQDPKLRVVRPQGRVSMRQNFECGLAHATGDYIVFFGDDDAALPGQFAALRHILATRRPDCLSWSKMSYGWPRESSKGKYGGVRFEREKLFGSVRPVSQDALLRRLLSADVDWYDEYPALYHGAVSRSCIEMLRPAGKDFFQAKVPDIYFTMLAIMWGIDHLHSDHPFTINGHSPASTGGAYARQKTATEPGGALDAASRFQSEAETDTLQDPVQIGIGIPAAFFETFEAVRRRLGTEAPSADLAAWYRFVINRGAALSLEERRRQAEQLERHAADNGASAALTIALKEAEHTTNLTRAINLKRLSAQYRKLKGKLHSFRLNVALDSQNTVSTASRVADQVLADGLVQIQTGKLTRLQAWRDARTRAKPFPHEM